MIGPDAAHLWQHRSVGRGAGSNSATAFLSLTAVKAAVVRRPQGQLTPEGTGKLLVVDGVKTSRPRSTTSKGLVGGTMWVRNRQAATRGVGQLSN